MWQLLNFKKAENKKTKQNKKSIVKRKLPKIEKITPDILIIITDMSRLPIIFKKGHRNIDIN